MDKLMGIWWPFLVRVTLAISLFAVGCAQAGDRERGGMEAVEFQFRWRIE